MGMFTEEPLFEDSSLPEGWYRKVVQRQTGATAGQWDVYIFNPEGKKFRSRNELRAYLNQMGLDLSADDFDFSVKGKGNQPAKGKSPTKQASLPKTPQSADRQTTDRLSRIRKPQTPLSAPPAVRLQGPKRTSMGKNKTPKSLPRKKTRVSETKDEPEDEPQDEEEENEEDDDDQEPEVSNVKLKVKVGYTSSGAMIRPATGGRKKRKRFRNLDRKSPSPKKSPPPAEKDEEKNEKPTETSVAKIENAATPVQKKKDTPAAAKKRKKLAEPVPGPSGLQKVKKGPRRVLRRHGQSESEDDEDYEYMCSLYPDTNESKAETTAETKAPEAEVVEKETEEPVLPPEEPEVQPEEQPEEEEKPPSTNGELPEVERPVEESNKAEERPEVPDEPEEKPEVPEERPEAAEEPEVNGNVGPMLTIDEVEPETENEAESADNDMQVVVIGDSLKDTHNYAKPPTIS